MKRCATYPARAKLSVFANPRPAEPPVVKAREITLAQSETLEDAAVCILSSALDQFVSNAPALRITGRPEAVHQMRVALRRMRAALGLLRPAIGGPKLEEARAQAKKIADALGRARDWDVFLDMIDAGPRPQLGDAPGFFGLVDAIELRRRAAYRGVTAMLDARETYEFVSNLRRTLALRDWQADDRTRAPGSARLFASEALTRLRKRVLKKSRGLAQLSPDARHQTRIAIKKARYGAEFFHSLFDDARGARRFSKVLAKVQDGLGVYNDMATVNRLLDDIDADAAPATREASGFVRGWFAHAAQAGAEHAQESEKKVSGLKAFWR